MPYSYKCLKLPLIICILFFSLIKSYAQKNDFSESFTPLRHEILKSDDSLEELNTLLYEAAKSEIVAIGEATHGTQEVQQFQILLSKKLIEKHGFKTVILGEVGTLRSFQIHDFLINGKRHNSLKDSFTQLHEFILWVNDFNKKTSSNVTILGADKDSPEFILGFIDNHFKFYENKELTPLLKNILANWNNKTTVDTITVNKDLATLQTALTKQKGVSDSLDFKIDLMARSLSHLKTSFIYRNEAETIYLKRDSIIFNNIVWLKESKNNNKLSIISTHNFHINKRRIMRNLFKETSTLGELLTQKYPKKYYSIATEVSEGVFSYGLTSFHNIVKSKNKLGTQISKKYKDTNYGILMVDKNSEYFLRNNNLEITLGTGLSSVIPTYGLLPEAFNAILYIKNSTPYRLLNNKNSFLILLELDSLVNAKISLQFNLNSAEENATIESNLIFLNHFGYPISYSSESNIIPPKKYEYQTPAETKNAIVWLKVMHQNKLKINEILVNEIPIPFDKISVMDSENLGYRKFISQNQIIISK